MRPFWHTGTFWAFALGLFLNAYVYGIAAVALLRSALFGSLATLGMAWAPAGFLVGIVAGGVAADRYGRRIILAWGPLGYVTGLLGLLWAGGPSMVLASSLVLLVTAGVESNTILTYSQELLPLATRRQAMYAELNFVNLGGLALAAVALAGHRSAPPCTTCSPWCQWAWRSCHGPCAPAFPSRACGGKAAFAPVRPCLMITGLGS